MESIEIYNLIKCAQKETKNFIIEKMRKALNFEYSRDISAEKHWTKIQQDAYIKGLESAQELIHNAN